MKILNLMLEDMSFEDLVALQKAVNKKVIEKRNSDLGDLIKEITKIKKLNKKVEKLENLFNDFLEKNGFLKSIENCRFYINHEGFLHIYIYINHKVTKSLNFDIEKMEIIQNDGFTEEEIVLILKEIDLIINNK